MPIAAKAETLVRGDASARTVGVQGCIELEVRTGTAHGDERSYNSLLSWLAGMCSARRAKHRHGARR